MDRSKLEYMIKNLPEHKKWEFQEQVDPDGSYEFDDSTVKFLKNPDTQDPFILLAVPNYMDPASIEAYKEKYVKKFEKINAMCIENKIYPFFKNPKDLAESEETREDICEQEHESILNAFFGVERFRDYNPPIYEPEKE